VVRECWGILAEELGEDVTGHETNNQQDMEEPHGQIPEKNFGVFHF
jgi:hypothetical protein